MSKLNCCCRVKARYKRRACDFPGNISLKENMYSIWNISVGENVEKCCLLVCTIKNGVFISRFQVMTTFCLQNVSLWVGLYTLEVNPRTMGGDNKLVLKTYTDVSKEFEPFLRIFHSTKWRQTPVGSMVRSQYPLVQERVGCGTWVEPLEKIGLEASALGWAYWLPACDATG